MLFQNKYVNSENNYECEKFKENFVDSYQPQNKDTKQIQCAISTTTLPEEISANISTTNFHVHQDNVPQYRRTGRMRYTNFPNKEIISSKPTKMKFNHMKKIRSSTLDNCINRSARKINENKNNKGVSRNTYTDTYVIEMDIPLSESLQSQTAEDSAYHIKNFKAPAKEHCNEYNLDKQGVQDEVTSMTVSCPSSPPSKSLNFDTNNISSRLYNYLEKLKKIVT